VARWPFAAGGRVEILLATILMLAGLLGALLWPGLPSFLVFLLLGLLWVLILFFFRDPDRSSPADDRAVLSPADGRVLFVDEVEEPRFLKGRARRVGIFLSLLDVHVNRSPVSGVVELVEHRPGAFHQAFRPEASEQNEHNLLGIVRRDDRILVRQIAGILARRVVCNVRPGDPVTAGERFGLIKFGSRVETYLPAHYEVRVRPQDRVSGGVTVIATLPHASGEKHSGKPGGAR
jgi:phosphatidylserine decarboxylase